MTDDSNASELDWGGNGPRGATVHFYAENDMKDVEVERAEVGTENYWLLRHGIRSGPLRLPGQPGGQPGGLSWSKGKWLSRFRGHPLQNGFSGEFDVQPSLEPRSYTMVTAGQGILGLRLLAGGDSNSPEYAMEAVGIRFRCSTERIRTPKVLNNDSYEWSSDRWFPGETNQKYLPSSGEEFRTVPTAIITYVRPTSPWKDLCHVGDHIRGDAVSMLAEEAFLHGAGNNTRLFSKCYHTYVEVGTTAGFIRTQQPTVLLLTSSDLVRVFWTSPPLAGESSEDTQARQLITITAPPGRLRMQVQFKEGEGAIITRLDSDSPVAGSMQVGDCIAELNGTTVTCADDMARGSDKERVFGVVKATSPIEVGPVTGCRWWKEMFDPVNGTTLYDYRGVTLTSNRPNPDNLREEVTNVETPEGNSSSIYEGARIRTMSTGRRKSRSFDVSYHRRRRRLSGEDSCDHINRGQDSARVKQDLLLQTLLPYYNFRSHLPEFIDASAEMLDWTYRHDAPYIVSVDCPDGLSGMLQYVGFRCWCGLDRHPAHLDSEFCFKKGSSWHHVLSYSREIEEHWNSLQYYKLKQGVLFEGKACHSRFTKDTLKKYKLDMRYFEKFQYIPEQEARDVHSDFVRNTPGMHICKLGLREMLAKCLISNVLPFKCENNEYISPEEYFKDPEQRMTVAYWDFPSFVLNLDGDRLKENGTANYSDCYRDVTDYWYRKPKSNYRKQGCTNLSDEFRRAYRKK